MFEIRCEKRLPWKFVSFASSPKRASLLYEILLNLRRHSNHHRNRWTTPLIEWYIDQSRVNAYLLHDRQVWSYNSDSTTNPNEKVTKLEQRELNYRPCARASTSSKPQHLEPRPSEQNNHTSDHALVFETICTRT